MSAPLLMPGETPREWFTPASSPILFNIGLDLRSPIQHFAEEHPEIFGDCSSGSIDIPVIHAESPQLGVGKASVPDDGGVLGAEAGDCLRQDDPQRDDLDANPAISGGDGLHESPDLIVHVPPPIGASNPSSLSSDDGGVEPA